MSQLHTLIADVRRRWFATAALRTTGIAAAAAAVPAALAVVADALIAPEGTPLIILAAAAIALSLAAALIVLLRIERRPDDRRVARFVEERATGLPGVAALDDCVVSAVDAGQSGQERTPIAALIIASAMKNLDGVTASDLVTSSAIRRAALIAAAGTVLLVTAVLSGWPSLVRATETARLRWFPASIAINVTPGNARVVAGHPLRITARITAGGRSFSQLPPQLTVSAGSESRTVAMIHKGDSFEFEFESVDRTFQYRVAAGAARSAEYAVTALFPPRVQRIDIHYQYPSFSGLQPRDEEDGGDIYGPAGTRVLVRIFADKAIATGELAMGTGPVSLAASGDRTADAELTLAKDDSYRIRLRDSDGLTSDGDSEYFIRLMDDRPPEVRIMRPSGDQGITPLEEVSIEARADDDHGVSTLELVYAVGGGKEHVVPFAVTGTEIQKTGLHLLAAEDLKVKPGDVITYYARARDVGRGKRPTETKSDMFFLEVKPFSEEFVAAQSQAGAAQGGDPQIDSLIAAQKEIINATWNIERRSAAGRSADDIAAIAKAQAELKARAESMAAGGRPPRGREPFPQQIRPQQTQQIRSGEGIAAAIEAMTRATEQLGGQKTREAIPHEMAALNGLLQAQAEVRRRQVMQQASGSGGGGGNRSGQDLSALFDKELQRQQRTNYEQRSQVEERPEQRQSNDDALERIKDLARRQEELNQRQRELAQLSAEERKRQLEKLSREQQELREQMEELSRQQQSGSQQSSAMRDAAEQMRTAANDMRRDDQGAAQQSGGRAADQLRRLEQQMRGQSADARRRESGELQSEAQQIAQEQRRIAAESERLAKSGTQDQAARQRLAEEKDRLAGRVDELRRGAEQASNAGTNPKPPQGAREAAAEIQKQKIAERLRDSAKQDRKGGAPAGTDRQIAQALDQVVEKLGGTATAEARQLSDQLDRTREMREKLDRLEKQMADAKGKNDGQLEKLQQQYDQELRRTRDSLSRPNGSTGATPEEHEFSRSAPGTEAFKQDRSGWESLRKDVNRALEQQEAAISRRFAAKVAEAKLSAGGSDRVPEAYRQSISKYYESLAKVKK